MRAAVLLVLAGLQLVSGQQAPKRCTPDGFTALGKHGRCVANTDLVFQCSDKEVSLSVNDCSASEWCCYVQLPKAFAGSLSNDSIVSAPVVVKDKVAVAAVGSNAELMASIPVVAKAIATAWEIKMKQSIAAIDQGVDQVVASASGADVVPKAKAPKAHKKAAAKTTKAVEKVKEVLTTLAPVVVASSALPVVENKVLVATTMASAAADKILADKQAVATTMAAAGAAGAAVYGQPYGMMQQGYGGGGYGDNGYGSNGYEMSPLVQGYRADRRQFNRQYGQRKSEERYDANIDNHNNYDGYGQQNYGGGYQQPQYMTAAPYQAMGYQQGAYGSDGYDNDNDDDYNKGAYGASYSTYATATYPTVTYPTVTYPTVTYPSMAPYSAAPYQAQQYGGGYGDDSYGDMYKK